MIAFLRRLLGVASLAGAASALCVVPLQPTSWQHTCDQEPGMGTTLHITLTTHIDRAYSALNRSPIFPGVVTCSLNRVRYEFVAVQGAAEFPLDTFVSQVRATTHVLAPLEAVEVNTGVDSVMASDVPVPLGLVVGRPWALRITAIGGALIDHHGQITSTIDFAADADVDVSYLP